MIRKLQKNDDIEKNHHHEPESINSQTDSFKMYEPVPPTQPKLNDHIQELNKKGIYFENEKPMIDEDDDVDVVTPLVMAADIIMSSQSDDFVQDNTDPIVQDNTDTFVQDNTVPMSDTTFTPSDPGSTQQSWIDSSPSYDNSPSYDSSPSYDNSSSYDSSSSSSSYDSSSSSSYDSSSSSSSFDSGGSW